MFWLWEWRCCFILLDLTHEDMWPLKAPRLRKLEPFCVVMVGGRREAGVLCCLSPLGQYLPRPCPVPAAPYLNINSLKLNAHKCDLSHEPAVRYMGIAVFCGYANASHVWMSFWKCLCPIQQRARSNACRKPAPDQGAPGSVLWRALPWVRPKSATVPSLHYFVSVGITTQAFRAAKRTDPKSPFQTHWGPQAFLFCDKTKPPAYNF